MITPYDYLTTQHAWGAISNRGSNIYGPCPIHHGDNPNFVIYTQDQHWHCYMSGCAKHGDIVRLVKEMEFPELDAGQWAPVYRRVEELSGMPLPPRHHFIQRREVKPAASREQRAILTVARTWWNWVLTRLIDGRPGADWLTLQGIVPAPYYPWCIGYAPKMTTALFKSLDDMISSNLGTRDWHDLGIETGVLREDGTIRMQERVIFSCTNNEGEAVFYQGRTIHDGEPLAGKRRKAKYLGPPHLRKEPFFLPMKDDERRIEGTLIVESPKGPAILASHSIPCMATLGSGISREMLAQAGPPLYIATDNDMPTIREDTGEVSPGPGEKLAERIMVLCQQERIPYYRIVPPREDKDVDTWVKRCGVEPLLREMEKARGKG